MNERLLAQVRRRLQEAKSQLHTGAGAGAEGPDEADAGTPVDSPLGGRPKVLQGQASAGIPVDISALDFSTLASACLARSS